MKLTGISLFTGAGIGETYLKDIGVNIIVANELLEKRANLYRKLHPKTNLVCGDITSNETTKRIFEAIDGRKVDIIIASPPCQGMSVAGKNRNQETMVDDNRNYLVMNAIFLIEKLAPRYVIIENVPALLKVKLKYKNSPWSVMDILNDKFGKEYDIEAKVLDSADYGVPQTRLRAIIKLSKKGSSWNWPPKVSKKTTVKDAIGYLPSLESGQSSNIKWHYARKHDVRQVEWMKHTPTGQSAITNKVHYPQKEDGTRVKGYESSYRRIKWDEPSPTITIRSDAISSQRNVHPGRLLENGEYSDARVLTPLEIMILNSLPIDWNVPADTPEILMRQCIGESIPPLLIKKLVQEIKTHGE